MSRHRHMPPSNLKSDFEMEKKNLILVNLYVM